MPCWFPMWKRVATVSIDVLLPPLAFPEFVEDARREINSLTVDFGPLAASSAEMGLCSQAMEGRLWNASKNCVKSNITGWYPRTSLAFLLVDGKGTKRTEFACAAVELLHDSTTVVDIKENSRSSRSRAKESNKASRRAPLQDHNATSSDPAPADDGARIRELEALLRETQNQLRTTEARLRDAGDDEQHPTNHRNGQDDRINAPQRLSDVTMAQIRADLGYDKARWRALRSCVRDCLRAARLDWNLNWKSQSTTKRGYAYNAVEGDFPQLRRFIGQWAVDRIAKDVWDNRKTYLNCIDNTSTYIGRRAAKLALPPLARRNCARVRAPVFAAVPPHLAHQTRPRPRHLVRPPLSSADSGDDLLQFSDGECRNDAEEEEENDSNGKGKKHAKSGGGSSPKRPKH
ncbi:hypothetical protein B0H13DRAFT_1910772 [Mycena leptocephala]|nr:hypothetical protein B0H13DRAFT_1910772 [Mycena leptocephala]